MTTDPQIAALLLAKAGFVLLVVALVVVYLNRRKGVTVLQIYRQGSTLFRKENLERLVNQPAGSRAKAIASVGAVLFMAAALFIVASSLS